jgi:hypothetical protein
MPVVIEETVQVQDHNDSITVVNTSTGLTDGFLLWIGLGSDGVDSAASSTVSINGTPDEIVGTPVAAGASSPFFVSLYSGWDDGDTWPTTGTLLHTINTGYGNEGGALFELSDVDQTVPIGFGSTLDTQVLKSGTIMPTHSGVTGSDGDLVLIVCCADSGLTLTKPDAINGVAWLEHYNETNETLVGGSVQRGAVWSCLLDQDLTSTNIVAGTVGGGTSSNVASTLLVIQSESGGVPNGGTILPQMMQNLH